MNNPKQKILIGDSQFLITQSLKSLIESETDYTVCGIAESRAEIIALLHEQKPHLLITDFNMIDYENVEELRNLPDSFKNLSIMILSNQLNNLETGNLIKAGIKNIALKTDCKEELLSSIAMALKHKRHFSEPVLEMILQQGENKTANQEPCSLTASEIEVVKLVAHGNTTKEIAVKKNISIHTVMTHRKNIFRKLEINNVSELIRYAVKSGLIDYIEYNI